MMSFRLHYLQLRSSFLRFNHSGSAYNSTCKPVDAACNEFIATANRRKRARRRRHDVISKVVNILRAPPSVSSDPFLNLSKYLQAKGQSITTAQASKVLDSLTSPYLALLFFRFCPSNIPNFRHDIRTYSSILRILSKVHPALRLHNLRSVVDEMEKSEILGDIFTVNMLLRISGTGHKHDAATWLEKCLGFVQKWKLEMDGETYTCLVHAYLELKDVNKALDIYRDMEDRGYIADLVTYKRLLNAIDIDEKANRIFQDLKKHHEPDITTYSILIKKTSKFGKSDQVLALFDEMLSKGIPPSLLVCNAVIKQLAKSRMVDKLILFLSKMVENSCKPNKLTYGVILKVLAAEGQLERLDEVVDILRKYMDKSTYEYLALVLDKLGLSTEVQLLSREWQENLLLFGTEESLIGNVKSKYQSENDEGKGLAQMLRKLKTEKIAHLPDL